MSEALVFDSLDLIEVPISIKNDPTAYILREASGAAAAQYRNAVLSCSNETDKGKNYAGLADTEILLVSLCVFTKGDNGDLVPVGLQKIKTWPNRITGAIFKQAKKISNLDLGETTKESLIEAKAEIEDRLQRMEQSKNSPSSTTDGSS